MKNKYYNKYDFQHIHKLVKENCLEIALIEYENYLSKYPEDYCCLAHYADLLISLGRFEQAEAVLGSIIITSETKELSKQNVIQAKLKLLSCQRKYDKCLQIIISEDSEIFTKRNWDVIELSIFFKKQLGLLSVNDYSDFSYKANQIINYSEEAAIKCIKDYHFDIDRKPPLCFNEDFLVEEIYYKIREMLPLVHKTYETVIENAYIFKYDNCGKVNGNLVNYFKVTALKDSNDIITMYPCNNLSRDFCLDFTPVIEDQLPKVKRKSQIEKFNQKYGKMVDNN